MMRLSTYLPVMDTRRPAARIALVIVALTFLVACSAFSIMTARQPVADAARLGPLPAETPPLPFADNPDPTQCGIPTVWGLDDPAWITGEDDGELIQPVIYLYDSHLRRRVIGQIPHGERVRIELYQANPVLDYYRVRSLDMDMAQDGWIPAPFLSFEPVQ